VAGDWIKLHRRILRHWVFAHDEVLYLWLNLLLRANWKDGKFWPGGDSDVVIVKRGQLVTGRNSLQAGLYPKCGEDGRIIKRENPPPHPTTLWRWVKALERDGMISLDVRNKYTIITIVNYETYQCREDDQCPDDAQDVRKTCADGAPVMRTIEEGKELKNEFIPPLAETKPRKPRKTPQATPSDEPQAKTRTRTPRDDLFDAIAEITGTDPKASGSHVGRVVKALCSADPPYTPDEVRRLPEVLAKNKLNVPTTLGVVEKYIGWVRRPPSADGKPAETDAEKIARIARQNAEQRKQAGLE
jgi:hypothetical protein